MLFTFLWTVSACFESSGLIDDSTVAMISVVGMLVGVMPKFNPFLRSARSLRR